MKNNYKRRSDFSDMPRAFQLGILIYERDEVAETEEEKAKAKADVLRMQDVIEEYDTKHPAPEGGMMKHPNHDLYQQAWRQ